MPIVNCKCCKKEFKARQADLNRGWGKFCSKSCKAKEQEKRTGQYKTLLSANINYLLVNNQNKAMKDFLELERIHEIAMNDSEAGWDGHKDY